jgi:ferrous iron transport protein A
MQSIDSGLKPSSVPADVFALDHFQVGEKSFITNIQTDAELKQRLAALGLRVGCTVHILRKASFGGPVHVRVGTTEVIMRRSEAQRIVAAPVVDRVSFP